MNIKWIRAYRGDLPLRDPDGWQPGQDLPNIAAFLNATGWQVPAKGLAQWDGGGEDWPMP